MRLPTFYERIHAPTLGTSWGTGGIVMASMIFFTVLSTRPVVHEILIGIFVTVQSLPEVVRLVMTRNMWGNGAPAFIWPQLLPAVLKLALGLFLALQPGRTAALVTREHRLP